MEHPSETTESSQKPSNEGFFKIPRKKILIYAITASIGAVICIFKTEVISFLDRVFASKNVQGKNTMSNQAYITNNFFNQKSTTIKGNKKPLTPELKTPQLFKDLLKKRLITKKNSNDSSQSILIKNSKTSDSVNDLSSFKNHLKNISHGYYMSDYPDEDHPQVSIDSNRFKPDYYPINRYGLIVVTNCKDCDWIVFSVNKSNYYYGTPFNPSSIERNYNVGFINNEITSIPEHYLMIANQWYEFYIKDRALKTYGPFNFKITGGKSVLFIIQKK